MVGSASSTPLAAAAEGAISRHNAQDSITSRLGGVGQRDSVGPVRHFGGGCSKTVFPARRSTSVG
jgi:hypothetical protein